MFRRKTRSHNTRFAVEPLESRCLLSGMPNFSSSYHGPLPGNAVHLSALTQPTVASLLSKAVRQDLLNHLTLSNKSDLQAKLDQNKMGAFDGLLLSTMQGRAGQTF